MSNPQNPLYNIQFGKMTKSVTGEATGGCVTYYGALERNKKVSWVRYIPNGSLWAQVKTAFGRIPTFSLWSTVRDMYSTVYALDTNITVWEGRYMFCAKNWLAIPCHNRHMSCPGLSPPDLSVYGKYIYLTGQSWTTTYDRYGTK